MILGQLGNTAAQAWTAYRKFIKDGRSQGHEERYYQAVDQRFLGDDKFIEQIAERAPQRQIRPDRRKISFEKLLHALAQVHGCEAKHLTAAGRQRAWAKPRAQLAYLARDWCDMKAVEIARRLHRDASMVSRLCADYEAHRDPKTEGKIAEQLANNSFMQTPANSQGFATIRNGVTAYLAKLLQELSQAPNPVKEGLPSRGKEVKSLIGCPAVFLTRNQSEKPCGELEKKTKGLHVKEPLLSPLRSVIP